MDRISLTKVCQAQPNGSSETASANAGESEALPTPQGGVQLGDDAIAQIAALLAESFRADRKAASQERRMQEAAYRAETQQRVAELREKADAIRKEGLWSGIGLIGSGLLTAGGAGTSLGTDEAAWTNLGAGSGDAHHGVFKLAAEASRADQTEHDRAAIEHESRAELAKRASEDSSSEVDEARRMLEKVAEFLRGVRDSTNAAAQAALRKG